MGTKLYIYPDVQLTILHKQQRNNIMSHNKKMKKSQKIISEYIDSIYSPSEDKAENYQIDNEWLKRLMFAERLAEIDARNEGWRDDKIWAKEKDNNSCMVSPLSIAKEPILASPQTESLGSNDKLIAIVGADIMSHSNKMNNRMHRLHELRNEYRRSAIHIIKLEREYLKSASPTKKLKAALSEAKEEKYHTLREALLEVVYAEKDAEKAAVDEYWKNAELGLRSKINSDFTVSILPNVKEPILACPVTESNINKGYITPLDPFIK